MPNSTSENGEVVDHSLLVGEENQKRFSHSMGKRRGRRERKGETERARESDVVGDLD